MKINPIIKVNEEEKVLFVDSGKIPGIKTTYIDVREITSIGYFKLDEEQELNNEYRSKGSHCTMKNGTSVPISSDSIEDVYKLWLMFNQPQEVTNSDNDIDEYVEPEIDTTITKGDQVWIVESPGRAPVFGIVVDIDYDTRTITHKEYMHNIEHNYHSNFFDFITRDKNVAIQYSLEASKKQMLETEQAIKEINKMKETT